MGTVMSVFYFVCRQFLKHSWKVVFLTPQRYRLLHLGQEPIFAPSGVLMIDADLREARRVEQIKKVMAELYAINERLFLLHRDLHQFVSQAYALGATGVVHSAKEAVTIGPCFGFVNSPAQKFRSMAF